MAQTLDVNRWHACRPQYTYTPAMWFFHRLIESAYLDATAIVDRRPSDEAILARDWIACSIELPAASEPGFVSFAECCHWLGIDANTEMVGLLEKIDQLGDFDTDEAFERLESLSLQEAADDPEPLFEDMRIVPAVDQLTMFI
jgi:hypothetical protein